MDELQNRMSSREFAEWKAYNKISPGEPERSDLQTALMCMVYANVNKGRKGRAYTIQDFMLKFRPKKPVRRTAGEIAAKLKTWAAMHSSAISG